MADDRDRLRTSFDEDAELYDEVRPGYPPELFDDVITLSSVPNQGRVLEIGCGTGQATLPFAQRGYRLQCVELGANMAAVARRKLAAFPNVDIHVGPFEAWPAEEGAYDLTFSATAFHWIDSEVGYPRVAHALKPGGAFAVFTSEHARVDADQGIFAAVQEVYDRETPSITTDTKLLEPEDIPDESEKMRASGLFEVIATRRYVWAATYDTDTYLRLLNTYSGHRRLPAEARDRLFSGIAQVIETRGNGRITKGYVTVVTIGRRQ